LKAVRVIIEMRYKTEGGFVTQIDEIAKGDHRFIFTDRYGKQKLGKAMDHPNGWNYPFLTSSLVGRIVDKGEIIFFIKGSWTYRLRRMGVAMLA